MPEPNRNVVGFVAMDDRWIVVGVNRAPRGANGVLSTLTRIDVIDRRGGPVRTVVQGRARRRLRSGGYDASTRSPCSAARCTGSPAQQPLSIETGTLSSYDLVTGAVADVPIGRRA